MSDQLDKILTWLSPKVDKLLSGRFILTVICGLVFAYVSCTSRIEVAAITAILSSVFVSYFGRNDRTPPQNQAQPA